MTAFFIWLTFLTGYRATKLSNECYFYDSIEQL